MPFDDAMNRVSVPPAGGVPAKGIPSGVRVAGGLSRNVRADADYEIEAVSKARLIFEALEEGPVKRQRIEKITGFNRDLVMRTLRTWRLGGWVVENDRGEWSYGPRFIRLAQDAVRRS